MTEKTPKPSRTFKARIFEMIFSQPEECLELYNAVNGTNYADPEMLEVNTLENAIYMSMRNDVSFVIDSRLSLYEHQSTWNPNLPLRFLFYVANLYSAIVRGQNIYGRTLIKIPTPHFLIFYNGEEVLPEREELRLSRAFEVAEEKPSLELNATLLNINPGFNETLKSACRTLADYSVYTSRVRENIKTMDITQAVEDAIESCIRDNVLAEFLRKNRDEVKSVSIFEYDEEEHMRLERAENWEEGHRIGVEEGIGQGIKQGLEQGIEQGLEQGIEQGIEQGTMLTKKIFKLHMNGKSDMEIAELCEVPIDKVVEILS